MVRGGMVRARKELFIDTQATSEPGRVNQLCLLVRQHFLYTYAGGSAKESDDAHKQRDNAQEVTTSIVKRSRHFLFDWCSLPIINDYMLRNVTPKWDDLQD
ncbi:hypothetical protein EVAR_9102_1 [Eumeta japonica]|uniref:Uncharacterized protein n=1 Tax=Eumeta variegata TaxID=151549 RepID=A0A4C1TW64_EUMVA|nr:hypothetical protein EVAR_9102_1 [Eumeta japonica]